MIIVVMKILLTGFTPFLDHLSNPTEELVSFFQKEGYAGIVLPVDYQKAETLFKSQILPLKPDFILSLGLASSRSIITIENSAYNEKRSGAKDNSGHLAQGEMISSSGPAVLHTALSVPTLVSFLAGRGFLSAPSDDPGRYLCNEIYYLDLQSGIPSLFIHFPDVTASPIEKDIAFLREVLTFISSSKA